MAPPDAVETNRPPSSKSGILTPNSAKEWDLQTELSKIEHQPKPDTDSPVPFFHFVERLKTTKREGWRRFGINHGESIADHMYRMAIMTMLAPPSLAQKLNLDRCTKMALIHDMAEGLVGDITPADNVLKPEKSRREAETMDWVADQLLGKFNGGVNGKAIKEIWWEYERGETEESKFVHDIDKIELIHQMLEYERSNGGRLDLSEFMRVAARIEGEEMREWANTIVEEREEYWKSKGHAEAPKYEEKAKDAKQHDEYYGVNGDKK